MNTWLNRGASGGLETEAKQPTASDTEILTAAAAVLKSASA